jgi:hypothetical protein
MRIATISNLAPRKLGSIEDSLVAVVQAAARRGHKIDVFTLGPVHPTFRAGLRLLAHGGATSKLLSHI